MLLQGSKGIIMGVANSRSIATGIAAAASSVGAELGYAYLPDDSGKMLRRVTGAVESLQPAFILPCDVSSDSSIEEFFAAVRQSHWQELDFLVHAVAYAPLEDIRCPTIEASRAGFSLAMQVSVYSLIAVARAASKFMTNGGAIVTLTYYGSEKVVVGYNMMGVCKAALDSTVRYLAHDLGNQRITVNAISAGPIKTLAASAIPNFSKMQKLHQQLTPIPRSLTAADIGNLCAFLVSKQAAAITGDIIHVDNGSHVVASPSPAEG